MSFHSSRRGFLHHLGLGLFGVATGGKMADNFAMPGSPDEPLFFVGTYTNAGARGIYRCRLHMASGALALDQAVEGTVNPSFLAADRNRHRLFAVNETAQSDGGPGGSVSAFSYEPESGKLQFKNKRSSKGTDPCYIVVDATGRFVLVANYSSGSAAVLPVEEDGSLGEATDIVQHEGSSVNKKRQEGPHAHSVTLDGPNQFAYVADLGIDKVMIYRFDVTTGKLLRAQHSSAGLRPGAGPRHMAFHPGGKEAYVANELDSTLTRFAVDRSTGALEQLQVIPTVPAGFSGDNFPADIHVSPMGNFVYASNRGHDSIAVFAVDAKTGELTAAQHQPTGGKWPRNFAIDPTGRYLLVANQRSNNITVFMLDPDAGTLGPTGKQVEVPSPVCLRFA